MQGKPPCQYRQGGLWKIRGNEVKSMDSYYERNPVLLYIAKRIVEDVLDKTNEDYISAVSSPEADVLVKKLESFSQDQIHILQELIPWITMGTVSNMLWLFEQNEDIQLIVEYKGEKINIAKTSDGLDGEFCGEGGWIDRFGKYLDFMTIEAWRIYNLERDES